MKPTSNPEVGECSGCGWSGHYWRAAREPALPADTPKMPYVSIDIETTGLDPETCQTLEIGAVFDNWTLPLDKLPTFHCYVVHNADRRPALCPGPERRHPPQAGQSAEDRGLPAAERSRRRDGRLARPLRLGRVEAVTPAGKNFASFDRQFLKRLPDFEKKVRLHHRTLDPAMLFWLRGDEKAAGQQDVLRAGRDGPEGCPHRPGRRPGRGAADPHGVKRLRPC